MWRNFIRPYPLIAFLFFLMSFNELNANDRARAYQLHNRLTGVPPSNGVLNQMSAMIAANNIQGAAMVAMNHKDFYDTTLKLWAKKFTNVDQSNRVPLNDFAATMVGMIRDDLPFSQVMSGDFIYHVPLPPDGVADYERDSNVHYLEVEANFVSLRDNLARAQQSIMNGISDTAGVLTTRAAGEAFYSAGTNRRVTRYAFMNFLCRDFEALHDINVPDYRVRRDVDRAPGGDSRKFRNQCVGCHAGQDALGGAFSYFDYVDGELVHSPGEVADKVNANNLFSPGFYTNDDSWINLWATGQNASIGWRGSTTGRGAKELGAMLANTRAFSACMASHAFEIACARKPKSNTELADVDMLANYFENQDQYRMKPLIARAASTCL